MKIIRWPALAVSLLFTALIAVVSINNRPAADDFYYLSCVPVNGIISCVSDLYHGYSARWTAYFLAATVIPEKEWFRLFPIAVVLLLSLTMAAILHLISERFLSFRLRKADAMITGTVVCSALFFTSFSIGESWFWMIQTCTYLMSMTAQLVIFYCLLSQNKNRLPLIIASVFTGGSSESYALIVMAALLLLWVFRKKLSGKLFPENHFGLKILTALLCCFISFIIMMSSEGNWVRYEALPHAAPFEKIWIVIKTWGKAMVVKPFMVIHYYLLFGVISFVAGRQWALNSLISFSDFLKGWKVPFFLLPFVVLVMILPATVVMSGPPPDRAMLQVSFTLTSYVLLFFFDAGRKIKSLPAKIQVLKWIPMAVLLLMMMYHLVTQTFITASYASAFDERIAMLRELKSAGNKEMIDLKPLPPPGMLYSSEISEHEIHFTNSFLKKYLELEFEIRKSTE